MKYKRRNYFIDKKFQTDFILKFCGITVISSFLIGAFILLLARNFTTVAIENTHVMVKSTSDLLLPLVLETVVIATLFSAAAVIMLTLFASHKIAGPLYRLRKEIESITSGNLGANFRTRADDQLQELARSLLEMSEALKSKHKELKEKAASVRESRGDKDALARGLLEMEELLNYFKI